MEFEKLDPDFKAKWIAALRSGEYQQGKGELFKNGKYCCLGVAGAVCNVSKIMLEENVYLPLYIEDFNVLPEQLKGCGSALVAILTYKNDGCYDEKYNLNREKWNFNQIADWIEENL